MPYNIAKSLGEDTAADKRIEDCVASLTAKGMDKTRAIRICKASVQKGIANRRRKG